MSGHRETVCTLSDFHGGSRKSSSKLKSTKPVPISYDSTYIIMSLAELLRFLQDAKTDQLGRHDCISP